MTLEWKRIDGYQEARLGTGFFGCVPVNGGYMTLQHMPSCHRRGPWRLMITVSRSWGCFDDQDQPMRWYHSEATAKSEAEAIANVLVADMEVS